MGTGTRALGYEQEILYPAFLANAWLSEQAETAVDPDKLKRLQNRQRALERQWVRPLDLYQDDLMDKETLTQRNVRLDAERSQLAECVQLLQRQKRQQQAKDEMLADFETIASR